VTEPTGISLALTSAGPLSRAAWQALSKTPPSWATVGQYSPDHYSEETDTVCSQC